VHKLRNFVRVKSKGIDFDTFLLMDDLFFKYLFFTVNSFHSINSFGDEYKIHMMVFGTHGCSGIAKAPGLLKKIS
jgi:hypothetical protein